MSVVCSRLDVACWLFTRWEDDDECRVGENDGIRGRRKGDDDGWKQM